MPCEAATPSIRTCGHAKAVDSAIAGLLIKRILVVGWGPVRLGKGGWRGAAWSPTCSCLPHRTGSLERSQPPITHERGAPPTACRSVCRAAAGDRLSPAEYNNMHKPWLLEYVFRHAGGPFRLRICR